MENFLRRNRSSFSRKKDVTNIIKQKKKQKTHKACFLVVHFHHGRRGFLHLILKQVIPVGPNKVLKYQLNRMRQSSSFLGYTGLCEVCFSTHEMRKHKEVIIYVYFPSLRTFDPSLSFFLKALTLLLNLLICTVTL